MGFESQGLRTGRVARWQVALAAGVVFVIAVALRLPSCFDSLWVDELHTTWTIWGDLSDVQARARLGNQAPYFFWLMWFWHQAFGDSEVALRLAPVLMLATSCALLVAGIYRLRRDLMLGLVAGMLLAIDRNSVFFGTELRSYAAVVLFSTLLLLLAATRPRRLNRWHGIALPAVVVAALLMHYTALLVVAGTLVPFAIAGLMSRRHWNQRCRIVVFAAASTFAAIGVAVALEFRSLAAVWARRGQWEAFAVPRPMVAGDSLLDNGSRFLGDLVAMWPWMPMVLIPLGLLGVSWMMGQRPRLRRWLPLLCVALLVTLTAYLLASLKISAVWHRRYLVGLLPVFAWGAAALWLAGLRGLLAPLRRSVRFGNVSQIVIGLLFVVLPVGFLSMWQGTLPRYVRGRCQVVHRGEDWRGAVAAVQRSRTAEQPVAVVAGLIESRLLRRDLEESMSPLSESFLDYLCCPVNNIYPLEGAQPIAEISRSELLRLWQQAARASGADPAVIWVVARAPKSRHQQLLATMNSWMVTGDLDEGSELVSTSLVVGSFGDVVIIRFQGGL